MPDSTPPWKADDAFWDDAWKDMEKRLDGRRRRPWWLLLPLLALLGVWAGTQVQSTRGNEGANPAPTSIVPPVPSASVDHQTAGSEPERTLLATPPPVRETGTRTTTLPTPAPSSFTQDPVMQRGEVLEIDPPRPHPASPPQILPTPATAAVPRLPLLPVAVPLISARVSEMPTAPPVDTAAFRSTPLLRLSMVTGAGLQVHAPDWRSGAMAEAGVVVERGRWFLPLLLRYDYGRRSASLAPDEVALLEADLAGGLTYQSRSQLSARSADGYSSTLQLHTLAMTGGLGRQIGRRWQIAAGMGVGYLLDGQVPGLRVVPLAGGNTAAYQFDLRSLGAPAAAPPVVGLNATDPTLDGLQTELQRWDLTGWGRIDYRLGAHWSVGLEATRHLRSVYGQDLLREGRTRFAIGVRRRW